MANVGSGDIGKTLIGNGNGQGPKYSSIGTNSGLTAHGVVLSQNLGAFQTSPPSTAGQVLTSNGSLANASFQSPSFSSVFITTVTLTSTDVKSLESSAFTLVPGQGSGTSIVPWQLQSKLVYGGSNAFTNPQDIDVRYQDGSGMLVALIAGAGFVDQTADTYNLGQVAGNVITAATGIDNQPLVLFNSSSAITGNAANNNTIVVTIIYTVLTQ
jgi:hypothetical protein